MSAPPRSNPAGPDATELPAELVSRLRRARDMRDEDKLYRHRGVLYPLLMCPREHLSALEGVTAREDDILLAAYPKCGFNWMVGLLKKILTQATGRNIETNDPPLVEFFGPDVAEVMDGMASPRLLGTHMHPDNIPPSFYAKKTKMLVIFRNPKDTLVSYYHFCNGNPVLPSAASWDAFYEDFLSGEVGWGSYFEHAMAWEKKMDDPDVMIVTYEQLKQDLDDGVRRISSFLAAELTDDQVRLVSDGSTFAAMKENSQASHGMMGNVFFRKGEVGDWRNHFSEEQSLRMDQMFGQHLAGTRLGRLLDYELHCRCDAEEASR
ncbi:sulfotransferase 6B1 [Syngnathoides biaculeatus]|uniref:sulfotransferase 6B1 n=1 Tax=Syngnathoides biaculeatus TaxID=300417 RepID=UPI002ADDA37D|nr:sulfotransferase 6B1 [Syngnathoides biaculeatus]XP_061692487.1 sulfotransferase 6B1 [Syngnathoides biaculeatus]